jgi:hypothetical protein
VATATEETVRTEQVDWEAQKDGETGESVEEIAGDEVSGDPDGKALFDRSQYQKPELRIDEVDGQEVDKIWLKLTGRVALDRTKAEDVALFNRVRLGQDVELRVAGKGARVGTGYTTSKGGDLEAIVGEREIRIDTVYVLGPEEL